MKWFIPSDSRLDSRSRSIVSESFVDSRWVMVGWSVSLAERKSVGDDDPRYVQPTTPPVQRRPLPSRGPFTAAKSHTAVITSYNAVIG